MTICIVAACDEGRRLVFASDCMVTHQGLSIEFEHPKPKMTMLSDRCAALTAGDALSHTELFNTVSKEILTLSMPTICQIVDKIKECYQEKRKEEIIEQFLIPRGFPNLAAFYESHSTLHPDVISLILNQIDSFNYGLDILVAGVTNGEAHIYAIADPGTSQCFDAIGFHAIGSGYPHAVNSLIGREFHQGRGLRETLLMVYEAKMMAEKAPGVGRSITDISYIDHDGVNIFPREKIPLLGKVYQEWVSNDKSWETHLDTLLYEVRQ